MDITPLGDSAVILNVRDTFEDAPDETLDQVLAYFDFLKRANIPGIVELAPSYTTVTAFYDPCAAIAAGAQPDSVFDWIGGRIQTAISNGILRSKRESLTAIEIPVCYEEGYGLDLDEVTHHSGLSAA